MVQTDRWLSNGLLGIPLSLTSQAVLLRSYTARYFSLGHPEAPPLIVVPGLAGGMDLALPIARRLAAQFSVKVLQPRGEDDPSSLTPRTSLEELALDLVDFQESLGFERPLVMGLSFGGLAALQAASMFPGRFGGVVVQGVGPRMAHWALHQVATEALCRIHLPTDSGFVNQFFNLLFGTSWVVPELRQAVTRMCWRTDQGVMARRYLLAEQFDLEALVVGLRQVPLLIQTAAHDVIVSPEAWKPWRRVLPRMTLQSIERAGHLAFLTHIGQIAEQVERFACRRLGVAAQLPT
jgi:pimeloyl-ACP methyl ester carboxylesterase